MRKYFCETTRTNSLKCKVCDSFEWISFSLKANLSFCMRIWFNVCQALQAVTSSINWNHQLFTGSRQMLWSVKRFTLVEFGISINFHLDFVWLRNLISQQEICDSNWMREEEHAHKKAIWEQLSVSEFNEWNNPFSFKRCIIASDRERERVEINEYIIKIIIFIQGFNFLISIAKAGRKRVNGTEEREINSYSQLTWPGKSIFIDEITDVFTAVDCFYFDVCQMNWNERIYCNEFTIFGNITNPFSSSMFTFRLLD